MATVNYINTNNNSNGCIIPTKNLFSVAASIAVAPVARRRTYVVRSPSNLSSSSSNSRGVMRATLPLCKRTDRL